MAKKQVEIVVKDYLRHFGIIKLQLNGQFYMALKLLIPLTTRERSLLAIPATV